jgi:hypothetical protein
LPFKCDLQRYNKVELMKKGLAGSEESSGRQLWWVTAHAVGGKKKPTLSLAEEEEKRKTEAAAASSQVAGSRQEELVGKWMGGANQKLQAELEAAEEAANPRWGCTS